MSKKGEEHSRHVSLLFLTVLPTTLADSISIQSTPLATFRLNARRRLMLLTQAERSAARKPPDEWDLLATTFRLVTEVTI